jgi:hypothetical protein
MCRRRRARILLHLHIQTASIGVCAHRETCVEEEYV